MRKLIQSQFMNLPQEVKETINNRNAGGVVFFRQTITDKALSTFITLILGVPLAVFLATILFFVSTVEYDTGSYIFFGILALSCVFGLYWLLSNYIREIQVRRRIAAGNHPYGIYITKNYCALYLQYYGAEEAYLLPAEEIKQVQYTKNHFHSDNVSRENDMPSLLFRHTDDVDRYMIFNTSSFKMSAQEFVDAVKSMGIPFHEEIPLLYDDERKRNHFIIDP